MSERTSELATALGFIAGEGSFSIVKNTSNSKPYVGFRFDLQVDAKDGAVVDKMQEVFDGLGTVRHRARSDGREHVAWTVTGKDNLEAFRDIVASYDGPVWTATEKYANFEVWSDALDIYLDGRTGDEQQIQIARLAKGLNKGFGEQKWDEFIEDRQT